jgi:hypothetical protein
LKRKIGNSNKTREFPFSKWISSLKDLIDKSFLNKDI